MKTFRTKIFTNHCNLLTVFKFRVQDQDNSSSCGLFALCFATSLSLSLDPVLQVFEENTLRNHIKKCLENGRIEPYPTILDANVSGYTFRHIIKNKLKRNIVWSPNCEAEPYEILLKISNSP